MNPPAAGPRIVAIFFVLPSHVSSRKRPRIDWLGSGALILAVVPLLLALSFGGSTYAWGSIEEIGLFAMTLVFGAAFLFIESRAEAPTIPLDLFRNRIFTASAIITFLTSMAMYGAILYIPLFVQTALGNTASGSGVVLTPMMLGLIVVSIVSGQVLARTGHYKVLAVVGTAITVVGMLLLGQMNATTDTGIVARNMVVLGVGLGTSMALFTIVVQNAFPIERLGVVTASLAFFRSIGGVVGVAVLGAIMTNRVTTEMTAGTSRAVATASGVSQVFIVAAGLTCVALIASFFLKEIPLRKTGHTRAQDLEDEIGFEMGAGIGDELAAELVADAEAAART